MKRNVKALIGISLFVLLFLFCTANCVYADVVIDEPYLPKVDIDDVSNTTLLKVIIVLLTIILIMGIAIIKFLNSKYQLEVKVKRKGENVQNVAYSQMAGSAVNAAVGSSANVAAESTENDSNVENTAKQVNETIENANQESNKVDDDGNIRIELDMKGVFAIMLIIVAILIIVGIVM